MLRTEYVRSFTAMLEQVPLDPINFCDQDTMYPWSPVPPEQKALLLGIGGLALSIQENDDDTAAVAYAHDGTC